MDNEIKQTDPTDTTIEIQQPSSEATLNNIGQKLPELLEEFRKVERIRKSQSESIETQFMNSLDTVVKDFDRETRDIRDTVTKTRETVRDCNQQLSQILGIQPLMIEGQQNLDLQGDPGNNFQLANRKFHSQSMALSELVDDYQIYLRERRKQEITAGAVSLIALFILSVALFVNRKSIMGSFSKAGQQFKLPDLSLAGSWPFILIAIGVIITVGVGVLFFLRSQQAKRKAVIVQPSMGQASYCLYCGKQMQPGNSTCSHCGRQN